MVRISAKELKQHTGKIIGRIRSGERMTITYRGRPVAIMMPSGSERDVLDDDLLPFEEAWKEIEEALTRTTPPFKTWREAMAWVRKEHLS